MDGIFSFVEDFRQGKLPQEISDYGRILLFHGTQNGFCKINIWIIGGLCKYAGKRSFLSKIPRKIG